MRQLTFKRDMLADEYVNLLGYLFDHTIKVERRHWNGWYETLTNRHRCWLQERLAIDAAYLVNLRLTGSDEDLAWIKLRWL